MGERWRAIHVRARGDLAKLVKLGIFVASHKFMFSGDEVKWCGWLFSSEATAPDPDDIQGLLELPRPKNGGELMHFIYSVHLSRYALPEMEELETRLRDLLEECV